MFQWNFIQNAKYFIQENALEIVFCGNAYGDAYMRQ